MKKKDKEVKRLIKEINKNLPTFNRAGVRGSPDKDISMILKLIDDKIWLYKIERTYTKKRKSHTDSEIALMPIFDYDGYYETLKEIISKGIYSEELIKKLLPIFQETILTGFGMVLSISGMITGLGSIQPKEKKKEVPN